MLKTLIRATWPGLLLATGTLAGQPLPTAGEAGTRAAAGAPDASSTPSAAFVSSSTPNAAEPSIAPGTPPSAAHIWTEAALFAVRNDFARPPVHARNLYHLSGAMYDAWALFDDWATPLFLDSGVHSACALTDTEIEALRRLRAAPDASRDARRRVLSQAAWRLLRYRYRDAEEADAVRAHFDALAASQGLSASRGESRPAAQLGARVAACTIGMGRRDNANEDSNYTNLDYLPVNPPLNPLVSGNATLLRPSRWQPLALGEFIDQAGKLAQATEFVGADWGQVEPFALRDTDRGTVMRDGLPMPVYHDPGPPPSYERQPEAYARQFALVALWSAHLDPAAPTTIDIAPRARSGALGADDLATDPMDQLTFYDPDGGQVPVGESLARPGQYPATRVPLGDYARVVAEYWADGPDSETPPGHWFSLYNDHVSRHPALERRVAGQGAPLDPLAFDVLAYLALGGALHDAAITAWSIKGAYDYIRPVSAIRFLADVRQGVGLPGVPGRIERIQRGDELAGVGGILIGRSRLYGWRGPASIVDPSRDVAGVGWTLAADWWPYQRPNFVTPPFAGYVSGHSTFSRAAAVVLERLTGSAFWPGGVAGFTAKANEFLVFERGPSVDVPLQWATYRDAADQTGLSRIWGGIHPPVDDLVGRRLGARVGEEAWQRAWALFGTRQADAADAAVASPRGRTVSSSADEVPTVSEDTASVESEIDILPTRSASGCASTGGSRGVDSALLLMIGGAGLGLRRRRRRTGHLDHRQ